MTVTGSFAGVVVVVAAAGSVTNWAEVPRSRWKGRQREARNAGLRLRWTCSRSDQEQEGEQRDEIEDGDKSSSVVDDSDDD